MARTGRVTDLQRFEESVREDIVGVKQTSVTKPGWMTYVPNWVAQDFHNDHRTYIRGLMGPVGCGKSHACVMEMFLWALRAPMCKDGWRRIRFFAVRNTYQQLTDTTEDIFFRVFPPNGVDSICEFTKNNHQAVVRFEDKNTGDKIELQVHFRALDRAEDHSKILSVNTTGVWFNEWSEINQTIHGAMQSRLGRYPPVDMLKDPSERTMGGMLLDYNPPSPDSWQHDFFEKHGDQYRRLFKYPPGLAPDACNLDYLPKDYYVTTFIGRSQQDIQRYRDGLYTVTTSHDAVFTSYNDMTHRAEHVRYNPGADLYIGLDFGMTPSAVFLQKDTLSRWVVLDEITTEKMDMMMFAPILVERVRKYVGETFSNVHAYGDPSGAYGNETNMMQTVFTILAREGLEAYPASTNDLDTRLGVIGAPLSTLVAGIPRLRVSEKCKVLRRAMSDGYHYNLMGKPEKNEYSHVVDALGYALIGAGEHHQLRSERFRHVKDIPHAPTPTTGPGFADGRLLD